MEIKNKEVIEKLNHLIAIAEDGKKGYKNASEDVDDPKMKVLFTRFSDERASYVKQLQVQEITLGGSVAEGGGPIGALHRVWMDMKSVFTSGDKDAIINACITGEEAAVTAYEDALKNEFITRKIRDVINEQLSGIQNALQTIRSQSAEA